MKRFLFAGVALVVGSTLLARAQDAATQQRLDELSGRIENLIATQDALTKQMNELRRELSSVHELASKPPGNWASPEDLKRVAKGIEDVDRKRIADAELVQKQLQRIQQTLERPLPQPPRPPAATPRAAPVSDKATTPRDGVEVVIKPGDTLSGILQACREQNIKVTQKQILVANPGLKPNLLIPGKKIFIPALPQP